MTNWLIRYPRTKTAMAVVRKQAVFACGYNDGNRSEISRTIDPGLASAIFSFAVMVVNGKDPREAASMIQWPVKSQPVHPASTPKP